MKKIMRIFLLCLLCAALIPVNGQGAEANSREIQVYFEGERLKFEDTDPILIDSRTMVPFRKIFETLGFEIEWIEGKVRKVIGKKAGLTIELTIGSNKAIVNGKTVALDVPAQIRNGRTLVPLRFVSENSGFHVYFADNAGTFIIGIGATEESADPGIVKNPPAPKPSTPPIDNKVEPFVVKGRIVNVEGQPVPGAEVWADNTLLYNSNILGATDNNGYYRLELPNANTSYRMGARLDTEYEGQTYSFYMEPKSNQGFAGSTGAIRDFTLDINIGEIEVHSWDSLYPYDDNAPWFEMKDVELTLKPVGKLVDGNTGSTITGFPIRHDGDRLMQIPVGTYEISAIWKPDGYKAVPLLVSLKENEQYKEKITANFKSPFTGHHLIQLELQFP